MSQRHLEECLADGDGTLVEAGRQFAARLVKQVAHEVNNPAGTLALERFTLDRSVARLTDALTAGDLDQARALATAIGEASRNLRTAEERLALIGRTLDDAGGRWTEAGA